VAASVERSNPHRSHASAGVRLSAKVGLGGIDRGAGMRDLVGDGGRSGDGGRVH
jgi:hypothetical protein